MTRRPERGSDPGTRLRCPPPPRWRAPGTPSELLAPPFHDRINCESRRPFLRAGPETGAVTPNNDSVRQRSGRVADRDQPVTVPGTAHIITLNPRHSPQGAFSSVPRATAAYHSHHPDLVRLDLAAAERLVHGRLDKSPNFGYHVKYL